MNTPRLAAEYVLPLRWSTDDSRDDLTDYLRRLADWIDVTIVDGSPAELFAAHALSWDALVRHLPVAPGLASAANGKVGGVLTGIAAARHDSIVIADDDVRYAEDTLRALIAELDHAELVKPQNYFDPLPWHARWDTARTLLNRAVASDYPGTYAVRRSIIVRSGGYDGDALFENLELERTVRMAGGRVRVLPGLFIARRPPTFGHFRRQRVRQAYDSFAQPLRLVAEAAILPAVFCARRRPLLLIAAASAIMLLAETGRRSAGGRAVYPASSALWTPLWLLERGVCSWVAIAHRLRGGIAYSGHRLSRAANSRRRIRARLRRVSPGMA
ncbi:MAG: glycosyltransferase [Microbacterium sp.]|jgi:hypothetical protein|nr:glycosyltransferase [Microbacterium sp.]